MSLQFDTLKKFAHEHGVHLMQGGYVDYCRGTWRLQGSLAVSRGIGDLHLKQWVIPVPETKIINIETECEFLILASDGLWDKVQLLSGFIYLLLDCKTFLLLSLLSRVKMTICYS